MRNLAWNLILLAVLAVPTLPLPNGAPETSCFYLTPRHLHPHTNRRIYSQTDASPYNITLDSANFRPDTPVRVTISGYIPFKGFLMVGAEDGNQEWPTGQFHSSSRHAKSLTCTGRKDAVTHTHAGYKDSVTVLWYGPESMWGDQVSFVATVLANVSTYWTNIVSVPIRLDPNIAEAGVAGEGGPPVDPWLNRGTGTMQTVGWGGIGWNPFWNLFMGKKKK